MKRQLLWNLVLGLSVVAGGCSPSETDSSDAAAAETGQERASLSSTPLIQVEATDYDFTAPPTFPAGWVTLDFKNSGKQPHFLLLWRLPEGKGFDDWVTDVAEIFNSSYADYQSGQVGRDDFLKRLGSSLPEWFFSSTRMGGPGFTAPGLSSRTTVQLTPGNYVMECYVKAAEEPHQFHGALGMLRPLTVTAEKTDASPPEADVEIVLSSYRLSLTGDLSRGDHVVHVRIAEDPEGLILHNLHLAKLDGDTTAEEVARWMDWVDSLIPPAPAVFLGGAGQAVRGSDSYFTIHLDPGRYAWVSEAWGTQGMVDEFTVE